MAPISAVPPPGEGLGANAIALLPGGKRLSPGGRAALVGAAFAVSLAVAFAWRPWGFLVLGAIAGGLVAARVRAARAAFAPVTALAMALVPLVLPLFVAAGAGVVNSSAPLQFAVGLTTLLLAGLIVRSEWNRGSAALEPQPRTRSRTRGALQVVVPWFVAVIGVGVAIVFAADLLAGTGTSGACFAAAIGALVAALVLRIVGYARTAARALVALALLWLLARLSADIGLASGDWVEVGSTQAAAVASAVLLVVAALVELLIALLTRDLPALSGEPRDTLPLSARVGLFLETSAPARWVSDRLNLAGLGFALLSAALVICAVAVAAGVDGAEEDLADRPHGGEPSTQPSAMSDEALARAFSPVLVLTENQHLTPTSVDAYVEGAQVADWQGRSQSVHDVADLEPDCPRHVRAPCYVMTQRCPDGGDPVQCAEDLPREKAIYVRVARSSQWACGTAVCADGSPDPFAEAKGDWAPETSIIVQYWFFYPYNEWVAPVAVGKLKEIHAADWEAVTIGLSASRPLWVAYSAHCAGTFADWEKIRVAQNDSSRLHPLVAVAEGSQANYRVAENDRVPNFAECRGIRRDRLSLVSHAANILDRTDDAQRWSPDPGDLRLVDATTAPMSFPGTWAPHARMRLDTLHKSIRLGADGAGPASPPLQPLWLRPMKVIFGGGPWKAG